MVKLNEFINRIYKNKICNVSFVNGEIINILNPNRQLICIKGNYFYIEDYSSTITIRNILGIYIKDIYVNDKYPLGMFIQKGNKYLINNKEEYNNLEILMDKIIIKDMIKSYSINEIDKIELLDETGRIVASWNNKLSGVYIEESEINSKYIESKGKKVKIVTKDGEIIKGILDIYEDYILIKTEDKLIGIKEDRILSINNEE